MGQMAAIALLNGKYIKKHTPKYFFSCCGIIAFLLMSVLHFEGQGDNKKLCII